MNQETNASVRVTYITKPGVGASPEAHILIEGRVSRLLPMLWTDTMKRLYDRFDVTVHRGSDFIVVSYPKETKKSRMRMTVNTIITQATTLLDQQLEDRARSRDAHPSNGLTRADSSSRTGFHENNLRYLNDRRRRR